MNPNTPDGLNTPDSSESPGTPLTLGFPPSQVPPTPQQLRLAAKVLAAASGDFATNKIASDILRAYSIENAKPVGSLLLTLAQQMEVLGV